MLTTTTSSRSRVAVLCSFLLALVAAGGYLGVAFAEGADSKSDGVPAAVQETMDGLDANGSAFVASEGELCAVATLKRASGSACTEVSATEPMIMVTEEESVGRQLLVADPTSATTTVIVTLGDGSRLRAETASQENGTTLALTVEQSPVRIELLDKAGETVLAVEHGRDG